MLERRIGSVIHSSGMPANLTERVVKVLESYHLAVKLQEADAKKFLGDWATGKAEILEAFAAVKAVPGMDADLTVTIEGDTPGSEDLASLTLVMVAGLRKAVLQYKPEFTERRVYRTSRVNGDAGTPDYVPFPELARSFIDGDIEVLLKKLLGV